MISAIRFLNIIGLKHTTTETFTHLLMRQLTLNFQNDSEATGGMMTSSSPVASRNCANLTVQPENDLERKMTATSSRRCCERFEKFNHVGSWAKTFSALLVGMEGWYSTKCRLTWKLRGTRYNRLYFQLYPSTHRTEETEFGLLPTPRANDKNHSKIGQKSFYHRRDRYYMAEVAMDMASRGLLPTPSTRDYKGARSSEALEAAGRTERNSLPDLFHQTGMSSQLNPQFVMEMMGFPTDWTELPFRNGDKSPSKPEEMP